MHSVAAVSRDVQRRIDFRAALVVVAIMLILWEERGGAARDVLQMPNSSSFKMCCFCENVDGDSGIEVDRLSGPICEARSAFNL